MWRSGPGHRREKLGVGFARGAGRELHRHHRSGGSWNASVDSYRPLLNSGGGTSASRGTAGAAARRRSGRRPDVHRLEAAKPVLHDLELHLLPFGQSLEGTLLKG